MEEQNEEENEGEEEQEEFCEVLLRAELQSGVFYCVHLGLTGEKGWPGNH